MIIEKEVILSAAFMVKLLLGAMIGYVMHRQKKIEAKVEETMSRGEIRELIGDQLKPIEVLIKDGREDTREMAKKLDKLLDHMLAGK